VSRVASATAPRRPPVEARTVLTLGVSQLVCWGISYYLVAVFGDAIGAELGWSRAVVHGGFSAALLVMAFSSRLAGALIDRHGGRWVMTAGSLLTALGCSGLALAHGLAAWLAAWACLGLAMRFTLYDAAFAALARIGGAGARTAMSRITLLGGLASTTFWPIGHALAARVGWRGAVLAYAGFALLTVPLHLAIPATRHAPAAEGGTPERPPLAVSRADRVVAGALYALILTLVAVLNSAMSAHMIAILAGLGVGASLAVWVATLRGVGQSLARLAEILSGSRLDPFSLNVLASSLLPVCFLAAPWSGRSAAAAAAFAFLYGAGNGLSTIARGTLPLVLFDTASYGAIVGRLLVPSFVVSAAAPLAYALVIERLGERAALHLSLAISLAVLGAALWLRARFREPALRRG
jgi:MFS family permease